MFKKDAKVLLNSQRGMSLIEILIAITLLGVVGTLVVGNVMESLREGEIKSTKIQIKSIGKILLDYKRKCRMYPTTDQGLEALVDAPTTAPECKNYPKSGFITGGSVPQDAWGFDFDYQSDGRTYTITSYGADGMEGGEEEYADISSNDL